MVTNFTELNRKKPDGDFDGINFSFTPIVHDASDYGVLDTPNSIKFILHSINNFTKDTPIHIGSFNSPNEVIGIMFIFTILAFCYNIGTTLKFFESFDGNIG